jgi:hypothetical protein
LPQKPTHGRWLSLDALLRVERPKWWIMGYLIIFIIGICTGCALIMGWIMYEDWKVRNK